MEAFVPSTNVGSVVLGKPKSPSTPTAIDPNNWGKGFLQIVKEADPRMSETPLQRGRLSSLKLKSQGAGLWIRVWDAGFVF
mmetsp:Transcript_10407/g.16265  ORF Transcript_10407/g.16265 Transcript_10407/m.16265 type:complete len:81 (-) Transcript_10407:1093-1335(-)